MKHGTISLVCALLAALSANAYAGGFTVAVMHGPVTVRHGLDEKWGPCVKGDVLSREDAVGLAAGASAVLRSDDGATIRLPQGVIVELSDLRAMTPEELSLRMAMDQVRSLPPRDSKDSFGFPRTTSVHGSSAEKDAKKPSGDMTAGVMELNGTRVLYDNGYFGTCILRAHSVYSRYPSLADNADQRIVVAKSFESLGMKGEALTEYTGISSLKCTPATRSFVEQRIVELRQK